MKKLALTHHHHQSFTTNFSYGAERYVMLKIDNATTSTSLAIAANEVVQLLWATSLTVDDGAKLTVTYGGLTKNFRCSGRGRIKRGFDQILDTWARNIKFFFE